MAGALLLLMSLLSFASSAPLAGSATPTKLPGTPAAPRTQSPSQLLFPFVPSINSLPAKKGVALTYSNCAGVDQLYVVWQYGWGPTPANCPGLENIPMIYNAADVDATLGGNSQWVMGFNEPDFSNEGNLTPSQAAPVWRQIELKYPSRKLVAPAPSQLAPDWIADFRSAYIADYGTPPRLDALAVHCYAWQASVCIQFVQTYYEARAFSWGVPEVWVTEFSFAMTAPNTPSQSVQEAQTFIRWLEGESLITRFAWFASRIQGTEAWLPTDVDTPLIDWASGNLALYGNMYRPFP